MAKRPQKRSGELSAPELQQPVFDVTSQPVNTAIDPGAAGAPAKPLMQQDAVRPDLGPSQDMMRMGQALSGLSRTVRDLTTLEELRTQEAQKDAERLVAETDLSIAELVESGQLTGVTPAHIRGRGRALANQEALELANEYESKKAALRTAEGALEPDYMEKWLRKTAEERRANRRMAGVNEGYFNKRFNENFGRLLQKVNADHSTWAGKEHQSRAISDAKDALITLAKTAPYDPDGDNSQLYDAMYDLIEGRVDGRMTRRGTNIAIGQTAVDIMVEDPTMIPTMEFILDNMPTGPIVLPESFDPASSTRNKLGLPTDDSRKGRLGKIAEVSNYRNEKQGQIDRGLGTFNRSQAKAGFTAWGRGVAASIESQLVERIATNPKLGFTTLVDSLGVVDAQGLVQALIASDETLMEYVTDNPQTIEFDIDDDGRTVLMRNVVTDQTDRINVDNVLKKARNQRRSTLLQILTAERDGVPAVPPAIARARTSVELNELDPNSLLTMRESASMLTSRAGELIQALQDVGIEGVREDPAFQAFTGAGYQEWLAYESEGMNAFVAENGLLAEDFLYSVYHRMITSTDVTGVQTPEAAFELIVNSIEAQRRPGGANLDGLQQAIDRQLTKTGKSYAPEVIELAKQYMFIARGNRQGEASPQLVQEAVNWANGYIDKQSVYVGGTRYSVQSFSDVTESTFGDNGYIRLRQTYLGDKDASGSIVAEAFASGKASKEFYEVHASGTESIRITRIEAVDRNQMMRFKVYSEGSGLGGINALDNPNSTDGAFSFAELLDMADVQIPGINIPTEEELQKESDRKAARAAELRIRAVRRILASSPQGYEVLGSFAGVSTEQRMRQEFEGGNIRMISREGLSFDLDTPEVKAFLKDHPHLEIFFSQDYLLKPPTGASRRGFNTDYIVYSPDGIARSGKPTRTERRSGQLRQDVAEGTLPYTYFDAGTGFNRDIAYLLLQSTALRTYEEITTNGFGDYSAEEVKAVLPDLQWMGDPSMDIPAGMINRSGNVVTRTAGRIMEAAGEEGGGLVADDHEDYRTFGIFLVPDQYAKYAEAINNEDLEKTKLMIRLFEASPEGRSELLRIKMHLSNFDQNFTSRMGYGRVTRNHPAFRTGGAGDAYLDMTPEEKEILGAEFLFLNDPRGFGGVTDEENEELIADIIADEMRGSQQ